VHKVVIPAFFLLLLVILACSESEETITPAAVTNTPDYIPEEIEYDIGEKWKFTYYESGTEFGFNTYQVVRKGTPAGKTVYTFDSQLKLESSSSCKPTKFDTTYRLDSYGTPIRFDMSGRIGTG